MRWARMGKDFHADILGPGWQFRAERIRWHLEPVGVEESLGICPVNLSPNCPCARVLKGLKDSRGVWPYAPTVLLPHPVGASLALNALPTQVLELDLLF